MNWLDWLVIFVLLINTFDGFRKGFITSLLSTMGFGVSIYGAVVYTPWLSQVLNKNFNLNENIKEALLIHLSFGLKTHQTEIEQTTSTKLMEALSESALPEAIKKIFELNLDKIGDITFQGVASLGEMIAVFLSNFFVSAVSFVIILLVIRLGFYMVSLALNLITHSQPIGFLNRLFGMVFGALKGTLIIMVIFTLMMPLFSLKSFGFFIKTLETSSLACVIFNNNFLPPLIYKIFEGG